MTVNSKMNTEKNDRLQQDYKLLIKSEQNFGQRFQDFRNRNPFPPLRQIVNDPLCEMAATMFRKDPKFNISKTNR